MITIILLMVRARYWRAIAVGLLSAFVMAVAVAAPSYLAYADRAMINSEVAHAPIEQRSAQVESDLDLTQERDTSFEEHVPSAVQAPWWNTYFIASTDIYLTPVNQSAARNGGQSRLEYRQDYCAHVVLVSGRCPISNREVLLNPDTAKQLQVDTGGALSMLSVTNTPDGPAAGGPPVDISVVGIYRPRDAKDPFWGSAAEFTVPEGQFQPTFTEHGTLEALSAAKTERQTVFALLRTDALSPSMFAALTQKIAAVRSAAPALGKSVYANTDIPKLLAAVGRDRASLRQLMPLTTFPLVGLGCFVLFLIIAYAVQERRSEIGVVRLRGSRTPSRWWLAIGESLLPVLAGALAGALCGGLLARGIAAATLTSTDGVLTGTGSPKAVLVALALIVIAVLAAHARTLRESVADVLRRVPPRGQSWRSAFGETLIVALAIAAAVQARVQPGPLTGIMLLAPLLVVAAIAVLVARFVPLLAARVGEDYLGVRWRRTQASPTTRSARRKKARLGIGLGALQLARRPGAHRLLVVQIVAVGLCGFAVITSSVSAIARRNEVRASLGAGRVLTMDSTTAADLQNAVHEADPSGQYAMAAVTVEPGLSVDPPMLAVDSTRLAAVAAWPDDAGITASTAAHDLRPALLDKSLITSTELELRISTLNIDSGGTPLRLRLLVIPAGASTATTVDFGFLRPGKQTYRQSVAGCEEGCHLSRIQIDQPQQVPFTASLVIEALRSVAPTTTDIPLPLRDATSWRSVTLPGQALAATLTATTGGLTAALGVKLPGNAIDIATIRVPYPLPVIATTDTLHTQLRGLDATNQSVRVTIGAHNIPRLGTFGVLVDLDYLDAVANPGTSIHAPEVWLAAHTPRSVIAGLTATGLHIVSDVSAGQEAGFRNQQGPAVGARINFVWGIAGVLLAVVCIVLMAGIDRRQRADELRMLRTQGISMATVRRASLVAQIALVLAGAVMGIGAAFVAWYATGVRVPIFTSGGATVLLLPRWLDVIVPAAAVATLVVLAASGTVLDTTRLTRRPANGDGWSGAGGGMGSTR
jgi:putative ABC transport system permease protein